ncbi:DNA/RNA helicase domain-containing protein [Burkholderia seminalis]|uniref:DNA/RNA helicase domain-containing protein n=1 Tax=Burkholderia seminalis TaxID=488731 RepID=UPI00159EF869|nr:DNA/RNA helicase domain-containing protein [Burkholderia seminalis]
MLDFKGFLSHYGIEIKPAEVEDLKSLVVALRASAQGVSFLDKFYVGYKIPQIGKEFDLLRFGTDHIVNIELKKTCAEDRIKKQLERNKYYLGFIGRPFYNFTFVSDEKKLYFLNNGGDLEEVKVEDLTKLLAEQKVNDAENPDDLFNPADYLVSPFNSTKKFLANEYFLTHQQEEIKKKIIDFMLSPKSAKFISVMGGAGTGKTLLVYDIAKEAIYGKGNPLIIHCGQLNDGHLELRKNGWDIVAIKDYEKRDISKYDLIVVDEAQRISEKQLEDIVGKVKKVEGRCIFSHDKLQTLADWEGRREISEKINAVASHAPYELSEKIRTNKEIAAFIKMLFNSKKTFAVSGGGNIEINYFDDVKDAKSYLDELDSEKWEVLRLTPSQYNKERHTEYSAISNKTSHQVIGQEFDGVAVAIDQYFSYDDDGDLTYSGKTYYQPEKMLFQNITRCRKKLNLVIIKNETLLNRCITILG